jgi:hypothetical protein
MSDKTPQLLTIEQQFTVAAFNSQVDRMSEQQAKDMLKLVNTQLEVQRATYNELLKHQWGLAADESNQRPAT